MCCKVITFRTKHISGCCLSILLCQSLYTAGKVPVKKPGAVQEMMSYFGIVFMCHKVRLVTARLIVFGKCLENGVFLSIQFFFINKTSLNNTEVTVTKRLG
jgi:hypothetical protein